MVESLRSANISWPMNDGGNLLQLHRTSLYYTDTSDCFVSFFLSSSHQSPCTIRSGDLLGPIWSVSLSLYNIHLRATHTMILSIRGVTIPIYLVSRAMDSIRWHVVLFKPVTVPTSDPKSEFLCQSSLSCAEPTDPPWTPCIPGISPTPSPPRITRTAIVPVL